MDAPAADAISTGPCQARPGSAMQGLGVFSAESWVVRQCASSGMSLVVVVFITIWHCLTVCFAKFLASCSENRTTSWSAWSPASRPWHWWGIKNGSRDLIGRDENPSAEERNNCPGLAGKGLEWSGVR